MTRRTLQSIFLLFFLWSSVWGSVEVAAARAYVAEQPRLLVRPLSQDGDMPGNVCINEFAVKGQEWVELYNPKSTAVSLAGWYIDDKKCGKPTNPLGNVTLAPGAYIVLEAGAPGWSLSRLSGDGEKIRLCDARSDEIDEVAYGDQGGAPVPPKDSSTARVSDGYDTNDHARDWNLDPSPTPGERNDTAPVALGTSLRINEVNNYPPPAEDALEVFNPLSEAVDLEGWWICDGDQWARLSSITVPSKGLQVIFLDAYDVGLKDEDVLYLFRPDGTRVDQIGFTYADWENTFQRFPNGVGPEDGYDWDSSGGGWSWLYLPASLGRVNVPPTGPRDGWVRWPSDRAAVGFLMQHFDEANDICTLLDIILAAFAAGFDPRTWPSASGDSPVDLLRAASGELISAQELSCAILASVAVAQDPRHFAGRDLVNALKQTQDPQTGQFGADLQAHAYAMLALRNVGEPPSSQAVAYVRARRGQDGAWARDGSTAPGTADTETTALVIQALFAAGDVDTARGAFAYLHRMQNSHGGFNQRVPATEGVVTDVSATALTLQAFQVIDAPLGRWTPQGTDPVGALLALWDPLRRSYISLDVSSPSALRATARAVQALEGMHIVDVTEEAP